MRSIPFRVSILLCAVFIFAVFVFSCATKPPTPAPAPEPAPTVAPQPTPEPAPQPTPEPATAPEPAPIPEPAFDKGPLDSLRAETLTLRKKAFDLGIPEVLPEDYAAADKAYVAGVGAYEAENWQASLDAFGNSTTLFTQLMPRGLSALADRAAGRAAEARSSAQTAGAETDSPARFYAADQDYTTALTAKSDGESEKAIASFDLARSLFELSGKHARALGLDSLISAKAYAVWDSGNAALGAARLADEASLFAAEGGSRLETNARAIDLLDEVILRYNLVVAKGRESVALGAQKTTSAAKAKAEGVKAQVAVKAEFAAAQDAMVVAGTLLDSGRFEEATDGFAASSELFENAFALADQKRQAALLGMEEADATAANSTKTAEDADALIASGAFELKPDVRN